MATERLLSCGERASMIRELSRLLGDISRQLRRTQIVADSMITQGQSPADIRTAIGGVLTDLHAACTEVQTQLTAVAWTYQDLVVPGCPATFGAVGIDAEDAAVVDGVERGYLMFGRVDDPMTHEVAGIATMFQIDDVIELSGSATAGNDGVFTVYATPSHDTTEHLTNGALTTSGMGVEWVATGNGWTFADDVAKHAAAESGNEGSITQAEGAMAETPVADQLYAVTFTVGQNGGEVAGSLSVYLQTGVAAGTVTAAGTYTFYSKYESGYGLVFAASSTFLGTVDNVSMVPCSRLYLDRVLGADATETNMEVKLLERTS